MSGLFSEAPEPPSILLVKDVVERVKTLAGEGGEDGDDPITPNRVSWRIRKRLHLPTKKTRDGATVTVSASDLKALREKYGLSEKRAEGQDEEVPF